MNNKVLLVRAVRGPVMLIVLGLLFVVDYFGPYPFYRTWPVLLIVFGAMKMLEKLLGRDDYGPGQAPAGGAS